MVGLTGNTVRSEGCVVTTLVDIAGDTGEERASCFSIGEKSKL